MTDPAIDVATFRSLQEAAGAEFVAELVGTFLDEAPRMTGQLAAALAAERSAMRPASPLAQRFVARAAA